MKIITRVELTWDGDVVDQESHEYEGPVALCGGSGGGKGAKTPDPVPAPAKPATGKDVTAASTQAVADQQTRAKQNLGQQGTILTGPLGATPVQQSGKTLLGS